ncbi:MAG: flagellar motor switch protein FliG [Planctomycetota bacterium]
MVDKPQTQDVRTAGLRKAAILLLSLDPDSATRVLAGLDKDTISAIGLEISRFEGVTKEERKKVLEEFSNLSTAHRYVNEGGFEYARKLIEKALPPDEARKILETLEQTLRSEPFDFLRKVPPETSLAFIQSENPQTIALILTYLPPTQAAEILAGLPLQKRIEVVKRIATIEQTDPQVIKNIEKVLEKKFVTTFRHVTVEKEGIKIAAEILNRTDRSTEKSILEKLEEEAPDLTVAIRKNMFVFEDLILVDDRGMQNLLKEIDMRQLAIALKLASDEVKEKFYRNMTKRARELLNDEMQYLGPVRLSEIEKIQQEILDKVRTLEEQGLLFIQGRTGGDQLIA